MSVSTGDRIESFTKTVLRTAGVVSLVVAFLAAAAPRVGIDTALLVVVLAVTVGTLSGLFLGKRDIDEAFDGVSQELDAVGDDIVNATATVLTAVEMWGRTTDGGRPTARVPDHVPMDLSRSSGVLMTIGAVGGAGIGLPFGLAAAVVGCVLGAVLGEVVDYRDRKKRRRRRLERAARRFLRRATGSPTLAAELREVTEGSDETGEYWIFEFETPTGDTHGVVCYPQRREFVLA